MVPETVPEVVWSMELMRNPGVCETRSVTTPLVKVVGMVETVVMTVRAPLMLETTAAAVVATSALGRRKYCRRRVLELEGVGTKTTDASLK